MWARIPFVAVVSFGWTSYMSLLRGAHADTTDTESVTA